MFASDDNSELIVRMFRLRPASNGSIIALLSLLALLVLSLVLMVIWQRRRDARRRILADEEELRRILARAELEPSEEELFARLVLAAGSAPLPCATSVGAFDRGVDGLLREAGGTAERGDLSRGLRALRKKLGLAQFRSGVPVASTRAIPADLPVVVTLPAEDGKGRPVTGSLVSTNEEAMTFRLAGPAAARPREGGREVAVAFTNPGDASYTFRARASGAREHGPAFLVVPHSAAASLTRVQNRGFARVEMSMMIKFHWLPQKRTRRSTGTSGRLEESMRELSGILTSISGGGIRLRTSARLAMGDFLRLTLPFLPEPFHDEPCFAEVVRARGSGTYGLRFEGINSRLQEAIIQHVRREELREISDRGSPISELRPESKSP